MRENKGNLISNKGIYLYRLYPCDSPQVARHASFFKDCMTVRDSLAQDALGLGMLRSSRDCHRTCSVEAVCFASAGLQQLLGWPYNPTTNPS